MGSERRRGVIVQETKKTRAKTRCRWFKVKEEEVMERGGVAWSQGGTGQITEDSGDKDKTAEKKKAQRAR